MYDACSSGALVYKIIRLLFFSFIFLNTHHHQYILTISDSHLLSSLSFCQQKFILTILIFTGDINFTSLRSLTMQFLTALSLFATAGSVTAFPFSARDDPSSPKDFNKACTLNTTLFADGNNQGPFLIAECTSGANPRTTSILPLNQ